MGVPFQHWKGSVKWFPTEGSFKMSFDPLMLTKEGYVMVIDMVPVALSIVSAVLDGGVRIDIKLHIMHCC